MAGQSGVVGQNHPSPRLAVVGNVHIGHQQVFLPHFGDPTAESGAAIHRGKLPNDGSTTNFDKGFFTAKFDGLGQGPHRCELKNMTLRSDIDKRVNGRVGPDDRSCPDGHILPDDGIGTDFHIRSDFGTGADNGGGVNHHFSPIEAIISASATKASSTKALPAPFTALRLSFRISTSKRSWSPGTTMRRNLARSMAMK